MNFSTDKQIDSLNNPEYKFLVSLKKNEIENQIINLLQKDLENVTN